MILIPLVAHGYSFSTDHNSYFHRRHVEGLVHHEVHLGHVFFNKPHWISGFHISRPWSRAAFQLFSLSLRKNGTRGNWNCRDCHHDRSHWETIFSPICCKEGILDLPSPHPGAKHSPATISFSISLWERMGPKETGITQLAMFIVPSWCTKEGTWNWNQDYSAFSSGWLLY